MHSKLFPRLTMRSAEWWCRGVLYEPVQFIREYLADGLEFEKVKSSVSVHVPCSSKEMGIHEDFLALARLCSSEVTDSGIVSPLLRSL
jgi:D-lactate dehydrogenase